MFGDGTLVGWVGENLKALAPFRIIRDYQQGAQFTLGHAGGWLSWFRWRFHGDTTQAKPHHAGWHFFIPILQDIEVVDVVADAIDLKVQNVTTTDDIAVAISCNVEYVIADAVQFYLGIQDLEVNFEAVARMVVSRRVRGKTWAEVYEGQKELEDEVKATLKRRAERYGVKVLDLGITDLGRTKVFRLLQSFS